MVGIAAAGCGWGFGSKVVVYWGYGHMDCGWVWEGRRSRMGVGKGKVGVTEI